MKKIINDKVVFDPFLYTLSLKDNDDIYVKLSPTTSNVLLEIINLNSSLISRDEILQRVWIDRGYPPSNAGLNNSISFLRKAYFDLTQEQLGIITKPKYGFEIIFTHGENDKAYGDDFEEYYAEPLSTLIPFEKKFLLFFKKDHTNFIIFITFILFSFSVMIFFINNSTFSFYFLENSQTRTYKYKKCDVVIYNSENINNNSNKNIDLKKKAIYEQDCEHEKAAYFIEDIKGKNNYFFYTKCTIDAETGRYVFCESYKKPSQTFKGM